MAWHGMALCCCNLLRVTVYYMDTWSLPEILKALPLYPDVSREIAVERFRLFGVLHAGRSHL
jgi:hypothetical protein